MGRTARTPVAAAGRLSLGTKIGYGVGDIFGGGSFVIISTWYLYFLTDVVRINPALAGTAFLVSKLYDAVTDPFEGVLTDRTRTRLGRRRPFLLGGIPFIFLSFFLMWYPVAFSTEGARFAWVLAAYLFFSTVYSIVLTPYNALAAELTLDYHERGSLMSWRIAFSAASSLVCAVAPLEIVKLFADERAGWIAMAATFGLFFALPFAAVVLLTRERPEFQQPLRSFSLKETFVGPLRMRTFRTTLGMYLASFVAMDAVMAIVVYFVTYYLGRPGQTQFMLGALLVTQIAVIPGYTALSRRLGKRTAFLVACLAWIAALATSFTLGPSTPTVWLYVFAVSVGLGTGGVILTIWSIFPDVPDVDELVSGERREGAYAALFQLLRKASSALGIFLIGQVLNAAGYRKPLEQVVDGARKSIPQVQTPQFIAALRFVFAIVPIVLVALAIAATLRFPLEPSAHARLKALLERLRAGTPGGGDAKDGAELARLLVGGKAVPAAAGPAKRGRRPRGS
jgi:oligogalacturonide transporter